MCLKWCLLGRKGHMAAIWRLSGRFLCRLVNECTCQSGRLKIPGKNLRSADDLIDLHLEVPAAKYMELAGK